MTKKERKRLKALQQARHELYWALLGVHREGEDFAAVADRVKTETGLSDEDFIAARCDANELMSQAWNIGYVAQLTIPTQPDLWTAERHRRGKDQF